MKKVLALVMVFSMVGFASAALQIEVADGKAVVTGRLDGDMYLILSAGDGGVLSNFGLGAQAPLASIAEMQGLASQFKELGGVPVPDGYEGEAWFLASFPGEAYLDGTQLVADLAMGVKGTEMGQYLREEIVTEGCEPGMWKIRSFYENIEISGAGLSLAFFDVAGQTGLITDKMVEFRSVNGETFVDGPCVPEPLTLSLLGLGALVLRRRS